MANNKGHSNDGHARRNVLRTLGSAAAVGSFGPWSTRATAARPTGDPISPDEHEPPNPDVQVRRVDRSVKSVSAQYPLLTLPEDAVISYIDDSDRSGKQRAEARQALADLRRKFPIKKEKDGNTTWLTLARPDATPTDEDAEKFKTAHRAFAEGAAGSGGLSTMQKTDIHRKMTRDACKEMGLGSTDTDQIASHADDPDNPDVQLGVPDGIPHEKQIEEGLEHGLNEILHHYGQYYDTDAFEVWNDSEHDQHSADFGGLGGGPYAADWHMYWADYYTGSTRNKYLGKATHYPADMAVPLHTGMGWEQVNLDIYYDVWSLSYKWSVSPMYWLHSEYETYVKDNWTGGHYLKWEFGSDQCSSDYCYYPINSVTQAMKDAAADSGQYAYDVYHHILDEGDVDWTSWDSDTKDWMQSITENCIDMTGLYIRGFIEEFY